MPCFSPSPILNTKGRQCNNNYCNNSPPKRETYCFANRKYKIGHSSALLLSASRRADWIVCACPARLNRILRDRSCQGPRPPRSHSSLAISLSGSQWLAAQPPAKVSRNASAKSGGRMPRFFMSATLYLGCSIRDIGCEVGHWSHLKSVALVIGPHRVVQLQC